jgi:hypothetical protein
MATVILQVPLDGAAHRRLRESPPGVVSDGEVIVEALAGDAYGRLDPPTAGQIVLSVPSPETLAREAADVPRAIAGAGSAPEPVVVVVEAAEELRDDELAAVLDGARRTERPVIVRVLAEPEP